LVVAHEDSAGRAVTWLRRAAGRPAAPVLSAPSHWKRARFWP